MSKNSSRPSPGLWLSTIVVFAYALYTALQGDYFMVKVLVCAITIGVIVLVVAYPLNLKRMLLTMFSSYSYVPSHIEEFDRLDLQELDRITAQWEELGFVRRGDFMGSSSDPKLGNWFSRIFEHESEAAVVELLQQFTPQKTMPFNSSVMSFWGQREQSQNHARRSQTSAASTPPLASPTTPQTSALLGEDLDLWVSATSNRPPNRYFALMSHPRLLGARLEETATPMEIWQLHQRRAVLIEARLGTPALRNNLSELVREHGRLINDIIVRRIRSTSSWTLARYALNHKHKPAIAIHDGELAPLS